MHYTIYKVTNKLTGKVYIGSHKTKKLDDGYMGSGKYLKYAINKHGLENFDKEILFVFDNPEEMYAKEAELVNEDFVAESNTYNLKVGGFGGFDYVNSEGFMNPTHSTDHAKMMSACRQQKLSKEKRQNVSRRGFDAAKNKLAEYNYLVATGVVDGGFKGKHHTEETKKKIGEANKELQKGKKNSQFGTMWVTNGTANKKIKKSVDIIPEGWYNGRTLNLPL